MKSISSAIWSCVLYLIKQTNRKSLILSNYFGGFLAFNHMHTRIWALSFSISNSNSGKGNNNNLNVLRLMFIGLVLRVVILVVVLLLFQFIFSLLFGCFNAALAQNQNIPFFLSFFNILNMQQTVESFALKCYDDSFIFSPCMILARFEMSYNNRTLFLTLSFD